MRVVIKSAFPGMQAIVLRITKIEKAFQNIFEELKPASLSGIIIQRYD
jgi:hypothetical protein